LNAELKTRELQSRERDVMRRENSAHSMPGTPSPRFFVRAWEFTQFAAVQGAICLLLSLLVGLLQMQFESAAGKVNEFAGLYIVIALWLAPIYWLIATPAHIYFYSRRYPSRYALSFFASACVVLAGSVLLMF
jgi:hypothetical protein